MTKADTEDNKQQYLPSVQLPENSIIAKVDAQQLDAIVALHEKGINVTIIDIDVYHAEQSRALELQRQLHEQKLEERNLEHIQKLEMRKLDEEEQDKRHARAMEKLAWFGEFAVKLSVLGGGLYLASIGSIQAGAILMGAVAYTFAKDYMKGAWKR